MHHGRPGPGMTLFTIPIDPGQLSASQTRYALVQWGNQGDIAVGQSSAFSWSTTSIGTADPSEEISQREDRRLGAMTAEDRAWETASLERHRERKERASRARASSGID